MSASAVRSGSAPKRDRMKIDGERAIWVLLAVVAVDVVVASVLRGRRTLDLLSGETTADSVLGAVGLVWLVVVLLAARGSVRALSTLRTRIADVTVSSHDWYWEADRDLVITYSSAAVTQLLGYAPDELIGRSLFDFVSPERVPDAQSIAAGSRATGVGWRDVQMPWRHASGRPVALVGNGVSVLDGHGRVTGFRGWRRPAASSPEEAGRLSGVRVQLVDLLATRALDVALQPITALDSRDILGFEALSRFDGTRTPDAWFADAAMLGMRTDVELLALERALRLLASDVALQRYLSVNASPELICDPRFAAAFAAVDLRRVVVEVTEHEVVSRYDGLNRALEPLRHRGMRLAVDDAGAGYASFAHVLQLRPDIIKIDRSVVSRTPTDAAARALVVAVTRLAAEMDATVVAEGIEDARELATLTVLAVQCGQGFHLGRPSTRPEQWRAWQLSGTAAADPATAPPRR